MMYLFSLIFSIFIAKFFLVIFRSFFFCWSFWQPWQRYADRRYPYYVRNIYIYINQLIILLIRNFDKESESEINKNQNLSCVKYFENSFIKNKLYEISFKFNMKEKKSPLFQDGFILYLKYIYWISND